MRTKWILTSLAAGALALAGCGVGGNDGTAAGGGGAAAAAGSPASSAGALATRSSPPLGTIVVDGTGRTVYVFDQDVPGATTSACTGACASLWHAVPAGSPTPAGLTGAVGSIRGTDGGQQATLAGHPLYTYAGDSAAGQTSGQGVMGIWWVVDPAGQEITGSATPSPVGVPGY